MPFQHEDGSGRDDAVSFGSVDQYKEYKALRGPALTEADEVLEMHLVNATDWIKTNFQGEWFGTITYSIQALPFPRTGLINPETGYAYDPSRMPPELLAATFELADESRAGRLFNKRDPSSPQIIEQTVGPITTKYNPLRPADIVAQPNFPFVRDLIRPLLAKAVSSGFRVERR